MEVVKIKNKINGAIVEVKKTLAADYIGTGKYEMYIQKEEIKKPEFKPKYNLKEE